jgi:hypothetical protein
MTARAIAAALASCLVLACPASAASAERFTTFPHSASINSSTDLPLNVDSERFKTLTTAVAASSGIPVDGDTPAVPGVKDAVNSIGFSANLPENVLGAYIYWPRRIYKMQRRCAHRVCKRVRRYVRTEIPEADVAFSTAFPWNQGPGYPAADEIDLPTVEFHELGHFRNPNRPHGRRCSGSPLTESLGYGEWWRGRHDWFEQDCTNVPATHKRFAAAPRPTNFIRIVHQLPDRTVGSNRP